MDRKLLLIYTLKLYFMFFTPYFLHVTLVSTQMYKKNLEAQKNQFSYNNHICSFSSCKSIVFCQKFLIFWAIIGEWVNEKERKCNKKKNWKNGKCLRKFGTNSVKKSCLNEKFHLSWEEEPVILLNTVAF